MIYKEKIFGKYTYLRHVQVEDAEFILSLRTDPLNSRYINDTENDLDLQIEWIKMQQSKPNDYYFVICDLKNNSKGVIALYNFNLDESKAEMGRLICPKAPIQLYESLFLVCDFCFYNMNLERMIYRMNPNNAEIIAVTRNWNSEFVGNGIYPNTDTKYVEFQTLRVKWPDLKVYMASRLEKFVLLTDRQELRATVISNQLRD